MKIKNVLLFALMGVAITSCMAGCAKTQGEQAKASQSQSSGQTATNGSQSSADATKTAELPPDKKPGAAPDPDEPKK